jgi:Ca2+-binding RTX toxin-like protein
MPPHSQWTLFFKLDDLTSEEADIVRNLVRQGATVEVGAVVVALPALAPDVTGTNGDDSLRGTAKADKINARAGNDWIVGLRGNDTLIGGRGRDVLYGGSGDDRLLIRDGAKDSADCGSGRDTVIADNKDGVRGNCETVLRPFPNVPPGP